jgi:hypothetical protein
MRAFFRLLLPAIVTFSFGAGAGCGQKAAVKQGPGARAPADKPAGQEPAKAQADLPRKIIYNLTVNLVVDDFNHAEEQLKQLLTAHKGYVVNSDVSGTPGSPRLGRWQVRVPAARADAFRDGVIKLGELEKSTTDAQDVTEEFYDLDAHIRNLKKEEERLLGHLEKSTPKLDDILKVEHEITRVRGEIERRQGRQNLIARLTDMTTVTITIRERSSYVPPEAATFSSTIARTFFKSWEALVDFGKALLLAAVALAPWLIPLGIIGVPAWLIIRRRSRKKGEVTLAQIADESGAAPPPSPGAG